MFKDLTGKQKLAIACAILSVLTVSTAQLTDMFGANIAKHIVSGAALINMMLNSILAVVTGQSNLIKDVASMPGVEKVTINQNANAALAQAATDPTLKNVGATTPEVRQSLLAKAGS